MSECFSGTSSYGSPAVTWVVVVAAAAAAASVAVICAKTKTAEPIEMRFGLRTRVGPENDVLDGGPDLPVERGNFGGERGAHSKIYAISCAKTAELIDLSFGLWTRVGPRKHRFNRIRQVALMCPILLNRLSAAVMRSYVNLL